MTRIPIAIWILLVVAAAGCARVQVSQDYAPGTAFPDIAAYAWQSDDQPKTGDLRGDNPLIGTRIRAAVDRVLAGRGWRPASKASADIHVAYHFQVNQKIASSGPRAGLGYGTGTYPGAGGIVLVTGADITSYDEGMLAIDLQDAADGSLLWRGIATFVMPLHPAPEEITALLDEAVALTLAQFPPGASASPPQNRD